MKLSEALFNQAQWWDITYTYPEHDPLWTYVAVEHLHLTFGNYLQGIAVKQQDTMVYLCLLEAEAQKDEEEFQSACFDVLEDHSAK